MFFDIIFTTVDELKSCTEALQLIKKGEWKKSHDIIERLNSSLAARIHGHLHRIEGDRWNASYWYRRANMKFPTESIEEEWHNINELLKNQ